jgi:hypothetical protein
MRKKLILSDHDLHPEQTNIKIKNASGKCMQSTVITTVSTNLASNFSRCTYTATPFTSGKRIAVLSRRLAKVWTSFRPHRSIPYRLRFRYLSSSGQYASQTLNECSEKLQQGKSLLLPGIVGKASRLFPATAENRCYSTFTFYTFHSSPPTTSLVFTTKTHFISSRF